MSSLTEQYLQSLSDEKYEEWHEEGFQQGIQQGIQQGVKQESIDSAVKHVYALVSGKDFSVDEAIAILQIEENMISEVKERVEAKLKDS